MNKTTMIVSERKTSTIVELIDVKIAVCGSCYNDDFFSMSLINDSNSKKANIGCLVDGDDDVDGNHNDELYRLNVYYCPLTHTAFKHKQQLHYSS